MRRRRVLMVLYMVWCVPGLLFQSARAEQPMLLETAASEALFEEGRDHLLHFRLFLAEDAFRQLELRPDGGIAAAYHLTVVSLLRAAVTDERAYIDQFFQRSDVLLERLEAVPESHWRTYLLGEAKVQRSVMYAKTEHYVRSALAGRSGYADLEESLRHDSTFYEPYKSIGFMHLLIGSLPRSQRRLLRIIGLRGTIQQGLDELRIAAEHSRLNREEALIHLGVADVTLNNSDGDGLQIFEELHKTYPESPLFNHLYGYALLMDRRASEAEEQFRAAVEAGQTADYFYIDYAEFFLAQSLFRQNRFAEAEQYYRHYLERHRGVALRDLAYMELGLTLEMLDRRDEALPFYRLVQGQRNYDSDKVARRAADRRLAAPLTPIERELFLAHNAFDAGRYERAEALLLAVLALPEATIDHQAEAAFRLGRVYQVQKRMDEAESAYRQVLATTGVDPTARWIPWSQFHLGELYVDQGATRDATEAYEAALAYDGTFDYQQALEQQAKAALGRLRADDE